MREMLSSLVVECSTTKAMPFSDATAPRAKSPCPPDDEMYWLPSDSDAH